MAHSENKISKIKLPNNVTYDIHDSEALHDKEIFWATYGTTTGEEIAAAVAAGKYVAVHRVSGTSTNVIYGNCTLHSGEGRWYFETFYGSYTRLYATCTTSGASWVNGTKAFVGDVRINNSSVIGSGQIADINTNSAYNATTNKIATMSDLPTKTSDLTNDSGFITNA